MGDERILAPLAVFFPDMFGLQGDQLFHKSEKFASDPSDPNDDDYLERTMTRHELVSSLVSQVCAIRLANFKLSWNRIYSGGLICMKFSSGSKVSLVR